MLKLIIIICSFFGAVYLVSKFDSAHKIVFTLGGIPFNWIMIAGLGILVMVMSKVTVK